MHYYFLTYLVCVRLCVCLDVDQGGTYLVLFGYSSYLQTAILYTNHLFCIGDFLTTPVRRRESKCPFYGGH